MLVMLFLLVILINVAVVAAVIAGVNATQKKSKLTSDVTFERVEYMNGSKLENFYDAPIDNPTWDDVSARIRKMMDVSDEHVLLTMKQATYGVRFMQAAQIEGGYDLQVGLEEGDQSKLVERIVDANELNERFQTFYRYAYVDNLGDFTPVKFFEN
ncbi:MAG: hypothetical protein J5696_07380 [Lachnospiraceae bacterium]|nr:hypothetical protein [Lachnospiraceae bacterium]